MTATLLVLGAIALVWIVLFGTMVAGDTVARRRAGGRDELAEWREKVDAMRRLQDEDGAA
jgi:hypothetical protein